MFKNLFMVLLFASLSLTVFSCGEKPNKEEAPANVDSRANAIEIANDFSEKVKRIYEEGMGNGVSWAVNEVFKLREDLETKYSTEFQDSIFKSTFDSIIEIRKPEIDQLVQKIDKK